MNVEFQNTNFPMLPPKPNESDRMIHIQHWINNLPMDTESCSYAPSAPDSSSDSCQQTNLYNKLSTFTSDNNNPMICDATVNNNNNNKLPIGCSRLFTETETQLIVDLFKDYFINGICPSTDEIRKRTECTELALYRNPTSLRGKVKRMIANRKWVGFMRQS